MKDIKIEVLDDVYTPLEDSVMLGKHIPKKLRGESVLDVGCGSGYLSIIAAKSGGNVTAIDLNHKALENTKLNAKNNKVSIRLHGSDLFTSIEGKYDLILFNPPYIPSDENDRFLSEGIKLATVSGKGGKNLIIRFLKEFKNYLNPSGRVLMIISSLTNIKESLEVSGWKEIDSMSFFFEKLHLMEFTN